MDAPHVRLMLNVGREAQAKTIDVAGALSLNSKINSERLLLVTDGATGSTL